MLSTQILFVACLLVVSSSASPKEGMMSRGRAHHTGQHKNLCETYTDVKLCEAAKDRCRSSCRRGRMAEGQMGQMKKNFDTCVEQLDISSLLSAFKASLKGDELESHGGQKNFFVDVEKESDLDAESEYEEETDTVVDHSERNHDMEMTPDMKMTPDMNMGSMMRHEGMMKKGMMMKHGMKKQGMMKHGMMKQGMMKHGMMKQGMMKHGMRRHGMMKKKCIAKRFLASLPADKSEAFRCCMANLKGKLEDGKLNREMVKEKITKKIIADPTALKGFVKGIDSCTQPETCEMTDFKECVFKSCIDEIISSLNA